MAAFRDAVCDPSLGALPRVCSGGRIRVVGARGSVQESALELNIWELLARILAAAALGGLVGLEREFSDQPAGFRTHILVSLGAAVFTMAGAYGVGPFLGEGPIRVSFDPTRVAAQVVTGIGFLGAGAIMRQGATARGLTTAAALWVTAAIGTAAGLGYWGGAIAATLTAVLSLYGLKRFEKSIFGRLKRGQHRLVIEMSPKLRLSDLAHTIENRGGRMQSMKLMSDEEGNRHLAATVNVQRGSSVEAILDDISEITGVRNVDLN
jgi:putative Mg2+ transporter-C (MgtC) family protein